MANTVSTVDLTNQTEVLEFSGTNAQDVAYARSFWQSLQLHPPLESRLVSTNIKQRLKVAPCPERSVNITTTRREDSPQAVRYKEGVALATSADEQWRLLKFTKARAEDMECVQRLRQIRVRKEQFAVSVRNDYTSTDFSTKIKGDTKSLFNDTDRVLVMPGRAYKLEIVPSSNYDMTS